MNMKKQITYKRYPSWISFYYLTLLRYYIPQIKGKVRGPPFEENFRSQKFLSNENFEISTKKCDFLHIKASKAHHI